MRSKMMTALIVLLCIFILIGIGLIVYMICNQDALQSELLQKKTGGYIPNVASLLQRLCSFRFDLKT